MARRFGADTLIKRRVTFLLEGLVGVRIFPRWGGMAGPGAVGTEPCGAHYSLGHHPHTNFSCAWDQAGPASDAGRGVLAMDRDIHPGRVRNLSGC